MKREKIEDERMITDAIISDQKDVVKCLNMLLGMRLTCNLMGFEGSGLVNFGFVVQRSKDIHLNHFCQGKTRIQSQVQIKYLLRFQNTKLGR